MVLPLNDDFKSIKGKLVESEDFKKLEDDTYMVRYWELLIPAKADGLLAEKPSKGSDVQFIWNHKGESRITKVFKNLYL